MGTRAGDRICVLYWCSVPVVLRAVWRGREDFVGKRYIYFFFIFPFLGDGTWFAGLVSEVRGVLCMTEC